MPYLLVHGLLRPLFTYFGCGMLVKLHLDHWTCATLSKQKFDSVFSMYLALKTNSMQLKTLLYSYIPLDLLNVIVPVSEVSSCDYSNHVKCSLLSRACSSPATKALVSSAKSVLPQRQTCSLLVINMFVCKVIHI